MPDAYAQHLIEERTMTKEEVEDVTKKQFEIFDKELKQVESYEPEKSYFKKQWEGFVQASNDLTIWDTGLSWDILSYIGRNSVYHPAEFVSGNISKTLIILLLFYFILESPSTN